jgi:hypothetical protein
LAIGKNDYTIDRKFKDFTPLNIVLKKGHFDLGKAPYFSFFKKETIFIYDFLIYFLVSWQYF